MKAQLIPITNPDGSRNSLSIFQPKHIDNCPILLIFPAMGVEGAYYASLAMKLVEQGFTVITTDLRGHGQSSLRPSKKVDFGYEEIIQQDYQSIIQTVKTRFPAQPLYLMGHSLGGQLASLYASRYADQVAGLILLAACTVYYKGWKGWKSWQILIGVQLAKMVVKWKGYFPGEKLGFAGLEAKTQMLDWAKNGWSGQYILKHSEFDYEAALAETQVPILAVSFAGDDLAPQKAVQNLTDKFHPDSPIHAVHLERKTPKPYNHFNWVKGNEEVVQVIRDWMKLK